MSLLGPFTFLQARALEGSMAVYRVHATRNETTGAILVDWHRPPGSKEPYELVKLVRPGKDTLDDGEPIMGQIPLPLSLPFV